MDEPGGSVYAMKRLASLTLGLCSALLFSGCAGNLSNPEDFMDAGTVPKSAEMVLAESCGTTGCHDDSSLAQDVSITHGM